MIPHARRDRVATLLLLAATALGGLALPAAAQAPEARTAEIHPYYARMLHEGTFAQERRDSAAAARDLRIAAFGLLAHPPLLASTLARLTLAQAALEQQTEAAETARRILLLEQRFGAYSASDLPAATRASFEDVLVELLPVNLLSEHYAFRHLAARVTAARLATLPVAERRAELQALARAQPAEPLWHRLLGDLELAAGRHAQALVHAHSVAAAAPDDPQLPCLRGLALAGSGRCAAAVADLDRCPATRTELDAARALLTCHAGLRQWQEAQRLVDELPVAVRSDRSLRSITRQVAREAARAARAQSAAAPSSRVVAPAKPAAPVAAPPAPAAASPPQTDELRTAPAANENGSSELPAGAQQQLAQVREWIAQARRLGDLGEALRVARAVADAYPASEEAARVAGEVAYRASRWQEAVDYLQRHGGPDDDQPNLLFYLAVSLYETGDRAAAAALLERALPGLGPTAFVESYRQRILEPQP